jgi:MinD superfamily P-loop ATPase
MEVMEQMCPTCPFRDGSPYEHLREDLANSALCHGSRICHSTGRNNAIHKETGKPPKICRGARDLQIQVLAGMGFLDEATDDAWERKQKELGI